MAEDKPQSPYKFMDITQASDEGTKRQALIDFYENNPLTTIEKLYNFSKYTPRIIMTRFLSRIECFKKVLNVQGSIMDCGVLFGSSLFTWAKASSIFEPVNSQRKIVGFDTFSGFPSISEKDKTGKSVHSVEGGLDLRDQGVFEEIQQAVKHYDAERSLGHIPKLELVKGDVCKTVPQYLEDNPGTLVSLLHLDMDIYEPTKVALEHFLPRMPKGALIVFDELNSPLWPGETIAMLEEIGGGRMKVERFPWDSYISYATVE